MQNPPALRTGTPGGFSASGENPGAISVHRSPAYLQVDNVFGLFLLFPSIVAGTITLGLMTQITNVFGQVRGAFQYLINSWTTLVELMSIYKRLRSFEHELDGDKIQEVTHTLS